MIGTVFLCPNAASFFFHFSEVVSCLKEYCLLQEKLRCYTHIFLVDRCLTFSSLLNNVCLLAEFGTDQRSSRVLERGLQHI